MCSCFFRNSHSINSDGLSLGNPRVSFQKAKLSAVESLILHISSYRDMFVYAGTSGYSITTPVFKPTSCCEAITAPNQRFFLSYRPASRRSKFEPERQTWMGRLTRQVSHVASKCTIRSEEENPALCAVSFSIEARSACCCDRKFR